MKTIKEAKRVSRHKRNRAKISGTNECPRLSVHCSLKNIQLQAIDDLSSRTILSMSTAGKEIRQKIPAAGNVKAAELLGGLFAGKAAEKGLKKVVFDRGGYAYHGRVKALACALRKGGLVF